MKRLEEKALFRNVNLWLARKEWLLSKPVMLMLEYMDKVLWVEYAEEKCTSVFPYPFANSLVSLEEELWL